MIGKYSAKLDEKNRLFVPSKLRGELGEQFYVTLGVNCGHRCLTVYTAEALRRVIKVIAITASKVKSSSANVGSGIGNNNQVAQAEIAKNLEEVADVEW